MREGACLLVTARFQQRLHWAIGLIGGREELAGGRARLRRLKESAGETSTPRASLYRYKRHKISAEEVAARQDKVALRQIIAPGYPAAFLCNCLRDERVSIRVVVCNGINTGNVFKITAGR